MLDALIKFIIRHPRLTEESRVKHLQEGKTGLQFGDYALIVPHWKDERVVLRLFRSGEDWLNNLDEKAQERLQRLVSEDISRTSNKELDRLLEKLFWEANPDYEEEDEE
ncbi:MAG: hypothetical protein JWN74_2394 [Acidobacteriaceae bacterium]|nr:hypothetical protein [Acidobacteriaceae bacterium]